MKDSLIKPEPVWNYFFDDARHALLKGICDHYDEVNRGGSPRWISLEAPSGWGKTRIVQELYATIAASQTEEYWPKSLVPPDTQISSIHQARKSIYPRFELFNRVSYSLPEFMWWGISCEARHGHSIDALHEDHDQLEAHKPFLSLAWASKVGMLKKYLGSHVGLKEFLKSLSIDGVAALVSEIPAIGTLVTIGKQYREMDLERAEKRSLLEQAGTIAKTESKELKLEPLIDYLVKIAIPGMPLIIFIDDLHRGLKESDADKPSILYLIQQLLLSDSPILILTTAWPSELEEIDRFHDLVADKHIQDRMIRVRHDQPMPASMPESASLAELSKDARKEIIKKRFPLTEERNIETLAYRYNNPLSLALICTLPKFGGINNFVVSEITADDIAALPKDIFGLYSSLWQLLPAGTQKALSILGYFGIHYRDSYNPLIFEPVLTAISQSPKKLHEDLMTYFSKLPSEWVRLESKRWSFWEGDQQLIAKKSFSHFFTEAEKKYLIELVAQSVCDVFSKSASRNFSDIDLAIQLVDQNLVSEEQEEIITAAFIDVEFVYTCINKSIDVIGDFAAYSKPGDRDVLDFSKLLHQYGVVSKKITDFIFASNKPGGAILYIDQEGRGDIALAKPIVGLKDLSDIDIEKLVAEDRIRTAPACGWKPDVSSCPMCNCQPDL